MTKLPSEEQQGSEQPHQRCEVCRRVLPSQRTGRPRKYCSQACRQRQWVAQQRAHELHLSEHELVVATSELDTLHDHLYVMACAVHDAERDLAAAGQRPGAAELREIIDWILDAARPLVAMYPASDPT